MKTIHLPQLPSRAFVLIALLLGSGLLSGTTLTYSGDFPGANPNALYEVNFSASSPANLTILTSSISNDGFQGVLWLFDSSGTTELAKNDPAVDQEAEISLSNFAAGTYLLVLSAWDQHYCRANNLPCNGVVYGNTGWSYNGSYGNDNLNYAFTIGVDQGSLTENSTGFVTNPTQAHPVLETASDPVPEPGSAVLVLIGAALLGIRRLRRR